MLARQPDRIEPVVAGCPTGPRHCDNVVEATDGFIVAPSNSSFGVEYLFKPFKLGNTNSGVNIGHSEIETYFIMNIVDADPGLCTEVPYSPRDIFVIRNDHAATACGHCRE